MIEGVTPWGAVHISERQFLHIWNEFHGARRLDQSPNNEPSNLLYSLNVHTRRTRLQCRLSLSADQRKYVSTKESATRTRDMGSVFITNITEYFCSKALNSNIHKWMKQMILWTYGHESYFETTRLFLINRLKLYLMKNFCKNLMLVHCHKSEHRILGRVDWPLSRIPWPLNYRQYCPPKRPEVFTCRNDLTSPDTFHFRFWNIQFV